MSDDIWGEDDLPTDEELAETEALFEALSAGRPAGSDPAAELLASLRADLEDRARRAPVVPIGAGRGRTRRRVGRGAVAGLIVAGVAFSGTGVAAALTSDPGDLLYPVRTAIAGPVNDNNNRMVTKLVAKAKALDTVPLTPATKTEAAAVINSAARSVPGIKDPGRRQKAAKALQQVQAQLGLAPSPIPTSTPSPTEAASPSPADSPSALPSPTSDPSPVESPAPSPEASDSPSPAPSASPSASPTRKHPKPTKSPGRSPKPSKSPKASTSPHPPSPSASPRLGRSPRPTPSSSAELSASPHEADSPHVAPASPSPS